MAAVSQFSNISAQQRLPRERISLAVAIAISTLVHLGLADGMVRAPGHAPSRGPTVIAVRLEIQEATTVVPAPPRDKVLGAGERVPVSKRHPVLPAEDRLPDPAVHQPSSAATFAVRTPDAGFSAAVLPPVYDPAYYPSSQLDVYPALVQPVNLEYPQHAANDGISGRVQLMLLIDETGSVREVTIIDPGPARLFEKKLRSAFTQARFSPARKGGRAVRSRVQIGVDYRPGVAAGTPP